MPINGEDAAIIGAVAFDKHRLIENQPPTIVAKPEAMNALAEKFRQLSTQWQEKQVGVAENPVTWSE